MVVTSLSSHKLSIKSISLLLFLILVNSWSTLTFRIPVPRWKSVSTEFILSQMLCLRSLKGAKPTWLQDPTATRHSELTEKDMVLRQVQSFHDPESSAWCGFSYNKSCEAHEFSNFNLETWGNSRDRARAGGGGRRRSIRSHPNTKLRRINS